MLACTGRYNSDRDNNKDQNQQTAKSHNNYAFSLFKRAGKHNYQIYRNNEKFASFHLTDDCKPISMRIFSDDCFLLISKGETDSVDKAAAIYRNGKQAMIMTPGFNATDFDINKGHFFVLGYFADSTIAIYRDGLPFIKRERDGYTPSNMFIFKDAIYYALTKNGTTEIWKNEQKQYEIPGTCSQLEISNQGIYAYADGKTYCNEKLFMSGNNYYWFFQKDIVANPVMFSLSSDKCYTAVVGRLEDVDKQYAAVFVNREHYITIKPDDKPIGTSKIETKCCAVAACNNGIYYITQNIGHNESFKEPVYHYYFNKQEEFTIQPTDSIAEFIMVKGH